MWLNTYIVNTCIISSTAITLYIRTWFLTALILLPSGLFLKYIWWQRMGSFKSSWAVWVSLGMVDWTNTTHRIRNMDTWVCWITQNTASRSFLPGGYEWALPVRGNFVLILLGGNVFVFQRPSKHVTDLSLMSQCFFFVIQLWAEVRDVPVSVSRKEAFHFIRRLHSKFRLIIF